MRFRQGEKVKNPKMHETEFVCAYDHLSQEFNSAKVLFVYGV